MASELSGMAGACGLQRRFAERRAYRRQGEAMALAVAALTGQNITIVASSRDEAERLFSDAKAIVGNEPGYTPESGRAAT